MADSREVMNIRQASQYLGVSPDTLYKYVGEQKIPAFKLGNRWRFKKSKLDQWMEEKSSQMVENFASGDMILLKNLVPAGLTPAYDASTGILQIGKGAINVASLAFENATLGTGSFHLGGDGHGHALLTHS